MNVQRTVLLPHPQGARSPRVVIIGLGEEYRGDDAAGVAAARRLRGRVAGEASVIEYGRGDLTALLEIWRDAGTAVVIDAVSSEDAPGTIHRFDTTVDPIPAWLGRTSTHALGLGEVVEMARALGSLPPRVIVYGITGRDFQIGAALSPEVTRAVRRVVARVRREAGTCQVEGVSGDA